MRFSPGFFGSLATGSGNWEIRLDPDVLSVRTSGRRETNAEYPSIVEVAVTPGLIWADVQIRSAGWTLRFKGIANGKARRLQTVLERRIAGALAERLRNNRETVQAVILALDEFLRRPKYLAHRDITLWAREQESRHGESIKLALYVWRHQYTPKDLFPLELRRGIERMLDVVSCQSDMLNQRNRSFVESDMRAYRAFFDQVEKTPLTREQRVASIVMEDRNLLVAAAGSGKTSTVVGKVGYALSRGLAAPHEILVLAFNNHAARELEHRINERLDDLLGTRRIKVKTFHALGLEVIAEATGKKPSVANFAAGGEMADARLMAELIDSLVGSDAEFARNWLQFHSLCRKEARDPAEFKSVRDWQDYVRETGDYRSGQSGYLTLNGEMVKSQGELAIANWLFLNGVDYHYERPYRYETADRQFRQYKPDFHFPAIDCYLEHYALDGQGNPPKAFGEKYRASVHWKQHLHASKGTDLIETTFAEFVQGTLFEKLRRELATRGVTPRPCSQKEILERINQPRLKSELASLLRTFIKHAKSNELDTAALEARAEAMPHRHRARLFVHLAGHVMGAYEKKLRDLGEVDFEDLIIEAARHAAEGRYRHPYQLILVDEFQDISRARAKLLLAFLDKAPDCKLFAVGDDWQSIYRFAGSDIALFTDFERVFGPTAVNYLTQTFRSNQGIADVAARFVQRNPGQMRKTVEAQDKTTENIVAIRQYARLEEMESLIEAALDELNVEARSVSEQATVFILARYRHQVPAQLRTWQRRFAAHLVIEFRTIHSCKGLQADYVILVGLHTGVYAFPSEVADDPLLRLVMPEAEDFPQAEERRLFYVALTRAKRRVYLLGGLHTASSFLVRLSNTAH